MTNQVKAERPGFDRKMTREEINACPIRMYEGLVHVIRTRQQLEPAVQKLLKEKILGFDIEIKPSFTKGENHPAALLQLAGSRAVYLFQLRHSKFTRALRKILSTADVIKTGVAPGQDIVKLKELGDFKEAGFVDLAAVAKQSGIKNHGLRGLAAVLLGFRILKHSKVSNWARQDLTPSQIQYAATDAWVSREIYLHMKKEGMQTLLPR